MNRMNGAALTLIEHIQQSIADILCTRIGSRVMRREYGSLLPDLVDHPFNDATRLRVYAATAMALMRWEPRMKLSRIRLEGLTLQGAVALDIEAVLVDLNQPMNLSIPLQLGAGA